MSAEANEKGKDEVLVAPTVEALGEKGGDADRNGNQSFVGNKLQSKLVHPSVSAGRDRKTICE